MPAVSATAPGKIILFGEHAVVYGKPAIAAPVSQVHARAVVMPEPHNNMHRIRVQAADIGLDAELDELPDTDPLGRIVRGVLAELGVKKSLACTLRISSTIPVASGLGSGAAVSVAVTRALAKFYAKPLPDEVVSRLAFEVEKLHHGTPSGIDNTVVTYCMPVYFVKNQPIEVLSLPIPFTIVIGDTGIRSLTSVVVGDVRRGWEADPIVYQTLFDSVEEVVVKARQRIERGDPESMGTLMNDNHKILSKMGVSSPELDSLVNAARSAGALGAKLSGAGRGGNMIALAPAEKAEAVSAALRAQGAVRTIITTVAAATQG